MARTGALDDDRVDPHPLDSQGKMRRGKRVADPSGQGALTDDGKLCRRQQRCFHQRAERDNQGQLGLEAAKALQPSREPAATCLSLYAAKKMAEHFRSEKIASGLTPTRINP